MSKTREKRIRKAAGILPDLIRMARKIHRSEVHARLAVLCAWANMAGVIGWTPGMVRRVEREMEAGNR
jgi:hypothetical protein